MFNFILIAVGAGNGSKADTLILRSKLATFVINGIINVHTLWHIKFISRKKPKGK